MLDDLIRTGAKPARGTQGSSHRTHNHIHLGRVDVLVFRHASARPPEHTETPSLVKDQPELEPVLQFDDLGQVDHVTHGLEEPLGDDESPGQGFVALLLGDLAQDPLKILRVIVFVPSHGRPTDLESFADGIIDRLVGDDDVAPLAECWDHTADRAKRLRVDDAGRSAQESGDISFDLHVYILGAVEARGSTWPHAVSAQRLNRAFFEHLIGDEVVEVVRGEVGDGAAIGQFRPRTSGPASGGDVGQIPEVKEVDNGGRRRTQI